MLSLRATIEDGCPFDNMSLDLIFGDGSSTDGSFTLMYEVAICTWRTAQMTALESSSPMFFGFGGGEKSPCIAPARPRLE